VVKSELVRILNDKLPELQTRDVELTVNSMLEQIIVALENGERIEIRGFGSFTLRHQPVRLARNPRLANQSICQQRYPIARSEH
jgi:integration host factor subunit beta